MKGICIATKGRIEGGGIAVATSGRVCPVDILAPIYEIVCNRLKGFLILYHEIKGYLQ